MTESRYKAFISYSHRDERWARWLQRSLEGYRVPRRLVGKMGTHGTVPSRLRPVFRDREDLSSASDLTGRIKEELERSEFLVVICSPAAAASRWANEEIRYFRDLGREDRILALVIDGDPHVDAGEATCFPEALLLSPDGSRREPLAADVRRYADGKHLALLKIIAGLLGVRLDELRRRDAHRRMQQRLVWGFVSAVLISILGWLLYSQAASRAAAKVQKANTEDLLSYMLGDLERLDPIAGVEGMTVMQPEYGSRVEQLGLAAMDAETLFEKALQWREAGGNFSWEGKLQSAQEQYENSHAALVELHRREGNTDRMLFELGQAEFYVGLMYVEKGDLEMAQVHWIQYGVLTRRLLNRQPNNPRYVMELAYTLVNLGALEQKFPIPDTNKSLELLQASLQYNQIALVLDPGNTEYRDSLAGTHEWLADTWLLKCALGNALKARRESVRLRRTLVQENPGDSYHAQQLAFTLNGLAGVQRQIGLEDEAVASYEEVVVILGLLHSEEPENEIIEWQLLYRQSLLASLLVWMGEAQRASDMVEGMAQRMHELSEAAAGQDLERSLDAGMFDLTRAQAFLALDETAQGEERLSASVSHLAGLVRDNPDVGEALESLGWAVYEYWAHFGRYPPEAENLLPDDFIPDPDATESCIAANLGARLAVVEGDLDRAGRYVAYTRSRGYFEAGFIAFCKRYGFLEAP